VSPDLPSVGDEPCVGMYVFKNSCRRLTSSPLEPGESLCVKAGPDKGEVEGEAGDPELGEGQSGVEGICGTDGVRVPVDG